MVTPDLVLRDVEIEGRGRSDCRIRRREVQAVHARLPSRAGDLVVDGGGGALLPGLTDHHLHLLATAAALESVQLDERHGVGAIARASARHDGWIRALGYDEVRHGAVDRATLDRVQPHVPVRLQHRGGSLWVVNTAGLRRLGLDTGPLVEGVERDQEGRPTGRLWRADALLADRLPPHEPDLAAVGAALASYGVTSVTEATPELREGGVDRIVRAMSDGRLPQHVTFLGVRDLPGSATRAALGPWKIVIGDHDLPALDHLIQDVRESHQALRSVALHCVTREALALTIAALGEAGVLAGDRVEHCAVADDDAVAFLARHGVTVVTQPTLPARRGDDYRHRCDRADLPDLWRYASLLRAGVRVAPSSDAPYGELSPWKAMADARDRRTPSGFVLGPDERVAPGRVLGGALSHPLSPGGPAIRVTLGSPADLVLLRQPLAEALADPSAVSVALTVIDGKVVYAG
ncbi:amidohydrolase family protein [Nonomuraea sp. NPDC002799]